MQRQQNRAPPASQVPAASARQNEYFVPRDGIDREVITSDICRYLGNDALVRPGTYESTDGRVTQGYFITAYRNLTSAMIQDLKADSARWEQERRAASRTSGGGAGGSREQPREQSNYAAWKNRQLDTNAYRPPPPPANMDVDMDMDYPPAAGPVNAGYAPAPYPPAQPPHGYPQQQYHPPPANQYQQPPYGGYQAPNPPPQYSPGPQSSTDRYPAMAAPPPIASGYAQDNAFVHGGAFQAAGGYGAPPPNRMTPIHSSAPPSRAFGATAGSPAYGSDDPYGYPPGSAGNPLQFQPPQPLDGTYGRAPGGSPAGTALSRPPFGTVPEPQYVDEHQSPALPNAPTPTNGTPSQIPPGPPAARRDAEPRDRERDPREHRPRRSEADREDRHAAERERARHRHGHR